MIITFSFPLVLPSQVPGLQCLPSPLPKSIASFSFIVVTHTYACDSVVMCVCLHKCINKLAESSFLLCVYMVQG